MVEMRDGCPKAEDILHVLRDRVALLPGTRDRNGRAVIIFPARENTAPINSDYIRNILIYLHAVTADDYKDRGFTIIIDMRKGTTWNNVKPILKCIQEHFPAEVHAVLIIKPDKFWEKHKTSVSSGKYKFDIQMISVEGLMRYVDSSQLTRDLGGSLFYDHDEWLEIRMELERLIWQTIDIMHNFENFREEIKNGEMPIDVATAERATSAHVTLKKKILGAPIERIQHDVERVRQRISGSSNGTHEDSCDLSNEPTANPDLAAALPNLASLINSLRTSKDEIFVQWETRRQKLDHCYQLKLFEQDADKMFDWIRSHYALSTQRLLEIGDSEQSTSMLLTEHLDFIAAANNTEVNVSHVMTVAKRLREIGNYGKVQIENVAMHLDEEWRRFKQINDQRSRLLDLALSFHRKSHIYLSNTPSWLHNITLDNSRRMGQYSGDELEAAIAEHERFGEIFLQTYAEAIGDGRSLTQILKTVANDAVGQNNAYKHVVDLIQQITRAHKELHSQWQAKKLRLHSRLALIAFETDTHRVLQWLEEHGDAYLNKNTAIGNNLSQAKVLQRNHSHFRSVASNTYSNAEKLFTASNTIIESGECDIQQMSVVVEELRRRIEAFSAKVEARRDLLNKSVLFHTHYNEIMEWYGRMEVKSSQYDFVSTNVQEGERRKEEWMIESDATAQAYATTMGEGNQLIRALEQQAKMMNIDNRETVSVIERLINDIEQRHAKLADRWPHQRRSLQLGVKFAAFIKDCRQIIQQLKNWREDMLALVKSNNFAERAEHILPYQDDNTTQVKNAVTGVKNNAAELLQALRDNESTLVNTEGILATDVIITSLQQLTDCQREVMQVAQETHHRIEQCMQFNRARAMAAVAIQKMQYEETKLLHMNTIPTSLEEALAAQAVHKQFQHAVESISRTTSSFLNKTDQLISNGGVDVRSVDDLNEEVLNRWRRLVGVTEERNKLIKAGVVCYKTLHQGVMPILDQLEKEYSISSKDWCQIRTGEDAKDRAHHMSSLLSKHMEYKERFLKGCSYGQKTSEMFLKYIRRCEASSEHIRLHETRLLALKENLRKRQMKILDLWMRKKQQLDRCHEACLLEATAAENAEWIGIEGEAFLKRCLERQLNIADRESLEAYMDEYMTFKAEAKQKRLKVRMMLELAEKFLSTLDHHCNAIERKMFDVRSSYEDFSMRLANYENLLSEALGRKLDVNKAKDEFSLDRKSDSNIEAKIEVERLANEEKRKMREPMMELIKSEKDYIEDLHKCIKYYLNAYHAANDTLPFAIRDKEKEIFSNIEQLYKFHNEIFLPELIKHENDPEDVGYCFIFSVEMLNTLYTEYCVNKEQNNYIIALPEAMQFFSEIRERNGLEHSQDLSSLVIKPVQRITRYRLMLEQLLKNCKNNVDEIKEAYDVVVSVPRRANDLMHLGNFENYEKLGVLGDFVMQESFLVWDPKAYFKKGRERQVFLFELCVVFAKKTELSSRAIKYTYKTHLMLAEINVCEHVEGDSSKFALRQGNEPNTEMRTELKATNEQCKVHWVKKIRELMQGLMTANFDMRQIPARNSGTTTTTSVSDRTSKDSDSLPTSNEDRNSLRSCASSNSNHNLEGHNEGCIAVGDFKATEKGQLSVTKGQRLEVVEYCADAPEWVLVSITWENGEQQRGLVPCSVISSIEPTDGSSASCSTDRPLVDPLYSLNNSSSTQNIIKRKSLRRFFSNGQQQQQQQQQLQQQQQQQGSSSGSHSRPQSVSLITRKGSGQQLRHSTADPLHSGSSSLIDQQHQNCVLSGDLVETDLTVGTTLAGGAHSVLSSCDDQINSTSEQEEETTAGGLLSVNPRLIDPASESTASLSDQGEFELPPPMSELSSAVADAAASRNTSMEDEHANDMLVVCPETTEDQNGGSEKEEKNPQDIARQKRQYVLMEFVETERDYVKDLSSVVDGYMANLQTMELPEDLVGKDKIIFANIAQILDFHKALFLKEIEKCLEDYEAVGNAFIKYERRLHTYYVKYCQNKPKSDFLMAQDDFEQFFAETKQKLGHKIALCDLLIKPVQRIMKYQLLMKDILKYTERAGDRTDVLEKALQVMHVVPKACDDMMQVGRLQNFDGNLNAQGKLIYQGTVAISDNAPSQPFKGKDRRIFLFEQSAIIADCILPKKEFGNPTYIFKSQIMMVLEANVPDEPLRFILKSNDPTQPNGFLAQANTMEEKDQWISKISSQLDQQKTFLAALVDPKRYQNQLAGSVNSLSLEEMEKKKALFPRLTGKSKESSNGSSGASSSLMHQNSNTQVLSSKSNSMAKSSKLFGFGKKMSPANSNKSAAGLFPVGKLK